MSAPVPAPPRRAFWRRLLPARFRQHGWLVVQSIVIVALVLALLRTAQIRPVVFSRKVVEAPALIRNERGLRDLFDRALPHEIAVELSDVEYQKLKNDFAGRGEKTWIRADVTIDGTRLESVGIRLKGNSTLMSLRGDRAVPGGPPAQSASKAPRLAPSAGVAPPPSPSGVPAVASSAAGIGGPPGGMANVSFDDPSTLPLVLGFDHFVKGRGYQGRSELAVRPVVGTSGAALNEAVALQLIADSGQISQRFTWVRFSLNGAPARTRLVLENPDQTYAASLERGEGALFKSKSTNAFTYKGEDLTQYTTDFAQLSAKGSLDLAPVIALLRFVDTASDADFDAQIARWIDVDEFAAYVATHDLLGNFDDMAGPGRNFLLWYDVSDRRFSVITWDMNLAISSMGAPGGMGGAAGPPGTALLAGGTPPWGVGTPPWGAGAPPWGAGTPPWGAGTPPAGAGMPPGMPKAAGSGSPLGAPGLGRGFPGGGGGPRMGNKLKQRFVASNALAARRSEVRQRLLALWFESGLGERRARELATAIPLTKSLTKEGIDLETAAVVTRLHALATSAAAPASAAPPAAPASATPPVLRSPP